MVKKVLNVIFWVVLVSLMVIWLVDFIQVKNDKNPKFCLKNVEHKYDDGTVTECVGLGYKVFTYNRTSMSAGKQFSPFFIKMKES